MHKQWGMMRIVFLRRSKPKPFNYQPVYYDPIKEEAEKRKEELDLIGKGDPRARMKAEIRRKWHRDEGNKSSRSSAIRTLIYIFIIASAIYLFFFTDFLEKLVLFLTHNG